MRQYLLALPILTALAFASCNESNFSSSNGKKSDAPAANEEIDENPTPSSNPDDCVDGDKINFNWTGEAKACIIDEGKTYNFDSNACMEMRKADFDCNWDNIKSAMKKLGLASSAIENDSADGAKLVSCGQSKDGNRIVAQWVKLPKGTSVDCKAEKTPGNITTGCYTLYVDQEPPPKAETVEEEREQVFDCMNNL